jgi:Zn-dependent metalloprotease
MPQETSMYLRIRALSASVVAIVALTISLVPQPIHGQVGETGRGRTTIHAQTTADRRSWTSRIDTMLRSGELRLRQTHDDPLVPDRTHERADQYYRGVRVFGGDVARQLRGGATESIFGTIYEGIDVDPSPAIDEDRAREILATRLGHEIGDRIVPELVVLPLDAGGYALTWRFRVVERGDTRQYFVDARTGATRLEYSDRKTQAAVGRATGVLGDSKKISVRAASGQFQTRDDLRPPTIETYDMKGDPVRTNNFLDGRINLSSNDLASDSDNDWTDGAVGDAHIYAGYTYDYYFKRFGRKGLNNADIRMQNLVHPVRRSDVQIYIDDYEDFFVNAFYDGGGVMVFGEGLPPNVTLGGQTWDFLAGSLDVVGHELSHGVTEYSANLIYRNESGALNEAFSDIMGTSIEFFFQPAGSGPLHADYVMGEDVVRPGGIRSLIDPGVFGDPDHYSKRFLGSADNGGVHINSTIPSHAFYLAIEGGTNRTSGIAVQGIGGANREQMEKVFYRAFTQLMPANSTFSVARAATIQAARDLYGANSAAERAVTAAWTAVGVN